MGGEVAVAVVLIHRRALQEEANPGLEVAPWDEMSDRLFRPGRLDGLITACIAQLGDAVVDGTAIR
jgi:hypothetical protein